jgi:glycosyltransferase involved in cell wall biosynthesis
VVYSFPHALGAPGIGWTAWNQVVELIAAGHRVHLVAASMHRPVDGVASLTTTLQWRSRRIPHRLLGRDRALAWHDRRAARVVHRTSPDVVHVWPLAARRTLAEAAALGIAAVREAPNTHTAHAFAVVAEESELIGVRPPKRSSHRFDAAHLAQEEREWDAATAILVPSVAVEATFLDRGFDPARLLRHRYGYRPAPASPPGRGRSSGLSALFLGRIEPRKGLHYGLRAWIASTASARGRFLIYGDSPSAAYRTYLQPLLDHPSVELHGFTADPSAALASADVLVLPSIEEGSALVTYEAQAFGCVPLVSREAGAPVDDGVNGLVHDARDVAALTAQFDRLDESPAELGRLAANALERSADLTWAAAGTMLVGAYRRAMSLSDADAG